MTETTAATIQDQDQTPGLDSLKLKVSADKLSLVLTCSSKFAASSDAQEIIEHSAHDLSITVPLDIEALKAALADSTESGQDIKDLTIAIGTAPEESKDEVIKWTRDFFSTEYQTDPETDMVDFRWSGVSSQVDEGELVVTVEPAYEGKDGTDVFGTKVPAAKPRKVKLQAGPNIKWDDTANGFRAECGGQLKYSHDKLQVDDVLRIKGDVGNQSGNVCHRGQVNINGDVLSEYTVKATSDIDIAGHIYAANVLCGGNLTVRGGIHSVRTRIVEVDGDIKTKFVDGAYLRAEGSIQIDSEIINSELHSPGSIVCRGRTVGGWTHAGTQIVVNEVGSWSGVHTVLIAGVSSEFPMAVKSSVGSAIEMTLLENRLQDQLSSLVSSGQKLSDTQRTNLAALNKRVKELKAEYDRVQKLNPLTHPPHDATDPIEIEVQSIAYSGCEFIVCGHREILFEKRTGPFVVRYDPEERRLLFTKPSK